MIFHGDMGVKEHAQALVEETRQRRLDEDLEPCPKVRQRMAFEKKRGRTPSEAQKTVIRATCSCSSCTSARTRSGR